MELSTTWIIVVALGSGWVIYTALITIVQYQRLSHIKGPFIASISPVWLFYHTCRGDLYLAIHAGFRKHGSPLRIAPNTIATDDPISQRAMAALKSPFTRGHWFKAMKLDPRVDNILSITDEAEHAAKRKRLIPGYTGAEVPSLELDVDTQIVQLLKLIDEEYASKNKSFDLSTIAAYFTLDVLTKITFGEALGFLSKNEDIYDYFKLSTDFFPVMDLACNHPTIFKLLNSPLLASAQPKPTDEIGFGAVAGHTHKLVAERYGKDAKVVHDMLGSFVNHGLTEEECQSESLVQLLAGADSTATSMRTTMLYLLTSPYIYSRLLCEILDTIVAGKASRPVITNSEAMALPYLRAVIMEGLRIFMPLQGLASRTPPKGGAELNGTWIPEGTQIAVATYAMLRREDLFGADADTFRPERWIDGDEKQIKNMERQHELVFGYGKSSCLGKQIALMELRKTFFEFILAFDMTLVNPLNPIYVRSNGVVVQKNMIVKAYARMNATTSTSGIV